MSFEVGYRSNLDTALVKVAAVAYFKTRNSCTHVLFTQKITNLLEPKFYQLRDIQLTSSLFIFHFKYR
ncbi:hypothetical protein Halhy_3754 [Haliscomenobacter hydrossis DSM 1100]|uniref:Uncharacterized protein n=1 Tax=Haliscomenobacter hydrossis (strain ATCC 27775 / DSM 1100 / LMG 10767 / O) TaxID=760192 RepID=F4L119_HALH1|nr:hypothetical protein Halhy_3754 [Haliscomenobacter hydrossis DSM 1100]